MYLVYAFFLFVNICGGWGDIEGVGKGMLGRFRIIGRIVLR